MKLPKQIQGDNNNPAILEIKAAMKTNKDMRIHERYQSILMYLHGEQIVQISKMTGRSIPTIYNYINAYKQGGIESLEMGRSTGRTRKLTSEQEQQVYEMVVHKTPVDVGFPARMNWTAPIIRKWIEQEWDVHFSERGTRDLLYRLKLSFTTPTYTLAKADPIKQEAFKQEFEDFKKNC